MPMVKKSEDEIKLDMEYEASRSVFLAKEEEKKRQFELDKIKLELSTPKKWEAIRVICDQLLNLPISILFIPIISILLILKREIPDFIKRLY